MVDLSVLQQIVAILKALGIIKDETASGGAGAAPNAKADPPVGAVPFTPPALNPPQAPVAAGDEVMIESMGLGLCMVDQDWYRDHELGDGTPRATRAILARLRDRREDLNPGSHVRLAVTVDPQFPKPVPHNEFRLHVQVDYAKGTGVQSGHCQTTIFAGPEEKDWSVDEGELGDFVKSVPNRWIKTRSWEFQLVFEAQDTNANASDYVVRMWTSYTRPDGRVVLSEPLILGYRHGKREANAGAKDRAREKANNG